MKKPHIIPTEMVTTTLIFSFGFLANVLKKEKEKSKVCKRCHKSNNTSITPLHLSNRNTLTSVRHFPSWTSYHDSCDNCYSLAISPEDQLCQRNCKYLWGKVGTLTYRIPHYNNINGNREKIKVEKTSDCPKFMSPRINLGGLTTKKVKRNTNSYTNNHHNMSKHHWWSYPWKHLHLRIEGLTTKK